MLVPIRSSNPWEHKIRNLQFPTVKPDHEINWNEKCISFLFSLNPVTYSLSFSIRLRRKYSTFAITKKQQKKQKQKTQTRTSLHQIGCSYLCLLVVMTCTYVCTAHRYGYVLDTHKSFQHLQIKPQEKRKTQRQHHTVLSEAYEERHMQRKPIYLYPFCFLLLPELDLYGNLQPRLQLKENA